MKRIAAITLLALSPLCFADDEEVITSQLLLKSSSSWDGTPLVYPKGAPEVISARVQIKDGVETGYHCHPVVTLAYVLEGTVEVETPDGKVKRFRKGESLAEVVGQWHKGTAVEGDLDLVVFYAGEQGTPVTIKPKTDDLLNEPCQ